MSFDIRPTGNIGFSITGLSSIVNSMNGMRVDIPIIETAVLNERARFFVNEAKRNVHRVSSDLYNSIGIESQSRSQVTIAAKTRYAAIENARRGEKAQTPKSRGPYGPHNYWDTAIRAVQRDFVSKIRVSYDKLWSRHKSH